MYLAPRKRKPLDAKKVTPHINSVHLEPRDGSSDLSRQKKSKHHRKKTQDVDDDARHSGEWSGYRNGAVTMTDAERRQEEERQRRLATNMRSHGNPLDISVDGSQSFSYDAGSGYLDSSMEDANQDLFWPAGSAVKQEKSVSMSII